MARKALDEAEILRKYVEDESVTINQLAQENEVSKTRIRNIMIKNNVPIRHVRHLTPDERMQICEKYFEQKVKSYQLAEEYDVNYTTIRDTLMKDSRYVGGRTRLEQEECESIIREYFENDVTHFELAERYGRTRSWIYRIIKRTQMEDPKYQVTSKSRADRKKTPKKKLCVSPAELVAEIEATKVTQKFLAEKYGVSESCINHAIARFKGKKH